jgi:hypothetical protein
MMASFASAREVNDVLSNELLTAVSENNIDSARSLLIRGATLKHRDEDGSPLVSLFCGARANGNLSGVLPLVRLLVESARPGAERNFLLTAPTAAGVSPIYAACSMLLSAELSYVLEEAATAPHEPQLASVAPLNPTPAHAAATRARLLDSVLNSNAPMPPLQRILTSVSAAVDRSSIVEPRRRMLRPNPEVAEAVTTGASTFDALISGVSALATAAPAARVRDLFTARRQNGHNVFHCLVTLRGAGDRPDWRYFWQRTATAWRRVASPPTLAEAEAALAAAAAAVAATGLCPGTPLEPFFALAENGHAPLRAALGAFSGRAARAVAAAADSACLPFDAAAEAAAAEAAVAVAAAVIPPPDADADADAGAGPDADAATEAPAADDYDLSKEIDAAVGHILRQYEVPPSLWPSLLAVRRPLLGSGDTLVLAGEVHLPLLVDFIRAGAELTGRDTLRTNVLHSLAQNVGGAATEARGLAQFVLDALSPVERTRLLRMQAQRPLRYASFASTMRGLRNAEPAEMLAMARTRQYPLTMASTPLAMAITRKNRYVAMEYIAAGARLALHPPPEPETAEQEEQQQAQESVLDAFDNTGGCGTALHLAATFGDSVFMRRLCDYVRATYKEAAVEAAEAAEAGFTVPGGASTVPAH